MKNTFRLQAHVDDLYRQKLLQLAFKAESHEEFSVWKHSLRTKLCELSGIAGRTVPVSVEAKLLKNAKKYFRTYAVGFTNKGFKPLVQAQIAVQLRKSCIYRQMLDYVPEDEIRPHFYTA